MLWVMWSPDQAGRRIVGGTMYALRHVPDPEATIGSGASVTRYGSAMILFSSWTMRSGTAASM